MAAVETGRPGRRESERLCNFVLRMVIGVVSIFTLKGMEGQKALKVTSKECGVIREDVSRSPCPPRHHPPSSATVFVIQDCTRDVSLQPS